jgi:hypothetical protein
MLKNQSPSNALWGTDVAKRVAESVYGHHGGLPKWEQRNYKKEGKETAKNE